MSLTALASLGHKVEDRLADFGDFSRFCGHAMFFAPSGLAGARPLRLLLPQLFAIGTLSVPVVMITGAFVGMVMAVQTVPQFAAIGMLSRVGSVVNHSVLRELGPVLAGVLIAGRVGGGLTAELGTMHVTEQIDALRAMGTDPIRVLVVPRFLACILLVPILTVYTTSMGIVGSYIITVHLFDVNSAEFWSHAQRTVGGFDLLIGPLKTLFFAVVISLISCYKGFHCAAGAAGVGRACTESFVISCMAILGMDLFLNMMANTIYQSLFGLKVVL